MSDSELTERQIAEIKERVNAYFTPEIKGFFAFSRAMAEMMHARVGHTWRDNVPGYAGVVCITCGEMLNAEKLVEV